MPHTKIVCTIGPASRSPEVLARLIPGMNVARLNFSHGTHAEHGEVIARIRKLAAEARTPIAILQDLGGPKVRVGAIEGGTITLEPGAKFTLTNRTVPGDARAVSVSHFALPRDVRVGDPILLADGSIELKVLSTSECDVECQIIVGGKLSAQKGINLPTRSITMPSLTDKDRRDLEFGIDQGVDFVALSFVRSADDLAQVKQILSARRASIPVIAKIEKHEALHHLDAIMDIADGIMVARGDLGVDIPLERVPRIQKQLIQQANRAGKPVITATQMLRSMVDNPRPTRAEVTDVANAILDGTDAVMLSEETAAGLYPEAAVTIMARIAEEVETTLPARDLDAHGDGGLSEKLAEAVSRAACRLADEIGAAAIVAFTQTGNTARLLAKHRPRQPILAPTPRPDVHRQLALSWGVVPILSEPVANSDQLLERVFDTALATGLVRRGDRIVIVAGAPVGVPGSTSFIKAEQIT